MRVARHAGTLETPAAVSLGQRLKWPEAANCGTAGYTRVGLLYSRHEALPDARELAYVAAMEVHRGTTPATQPAVASHATHLSSHACIRSSPIYIAADPRARAPSAARGSGARRSRLSSRPRGAVCSAQIVTESTSNLMSNLWHFLTTCIKTVLSNNWQHWQTADSTPGTLARSSTRYARYAPRTLISVLQSRNYRS